jgi:C4-dicarboxylate-binding protein DctP
MTGRKMALAPHTDTQQFAAGPREVLLETGRAFYQELTLKFSKTPLAAVLVAGLLSVSTAWAQNPVVLKFSHEAPETAVKGRTAKLFAEKVTEYSKGTLRVDVFPGAQLIPTKDEIRGAIRGQVDIIAPQTSYYSSLDASWDVFYQPLLFNNAKQGMDMLAGKFGRDMLGNLDRVGLKGLGIWHDGPGYLFVRKDPVVSPSQLAGKKIRVFPSAPLEAGVRAANGIAVSMPGPDVYLGLQQGLIEGVITAVTYAAPSRWYEVVKGATRMSMFTGGYGVTINKASWAKLSADHKKVIERAMADAESWNYTETDANILAAEKTLKDNGVTIADLTPAQLAEWRALMAPVYAAQPAAVKARIAEVQAAIK